MSSTGVSIRFNRLFSDGKNAVVYLQGSGSDAVVLTEAAEWHLSLDFELADDGAFGDTWLTQLKGRMRWSGSLNEIGRAHV